MAVELLCKRYPICLKELISPARSLAAYSCYLYLKLIPLEAAPHGFAYAIAALNYSCEAPCCAMDLLRVVDAFCVIQADNNDSSTADPRLAPMASGAAWSDVASTKSIQAIHGTEAEESRSVNDG